MIVKIKLIIAIMIESSSSTFFGYYDKSPFNKLNSNIILFHETNSSPKNKSNVLDICRNVVYDIHKNQRIANTVYTVWNMQQGASLHRFTDLTDSYTFEGRRKALYKLNFNTCKKEIIETFFEPIFCHGEIRCDLLHPRISHDKRFISIDTMQNNRRMMKIIDLYNEQK